LSPKKKQFLFVAFVFIVSPLFATKAPNFVLIYVDDLGWADTSVRMMRDVKGSRSYFHQTPALEKLAKRGVVFSNAYAPAPTCTPSRISLHYGKTNAKLGYTTVHDIAAHDRGLKESIPKDHISFPQMFKQANLGYVTAHFGKGIAIAKPQEIGYDSHDAYDTGDNGNYHGEFVKIAPVTERESLPEDDPKRIYSLTETAEKFLEKQSKSDHPFFMVVSHYSAHVPHAASPHMIEKYRNIPRGQYCRDEDYLDPSEMTKSQRTCTWRLQYAAMVEETDMSLGRIMDALDKHNMTNDTYIIFTSDNGGGLTPNGVLTGGKANLYEGGIRVPTVVAGPNMLKDTQCDVPITQWDLMSTFHDLSGSKTPAPKGLDGGSLREVFQKGNNGRVERPVPGIVFNYPYYAAAPINAIRIGDYKLMRQLNTGEERLYNVVEDLAEKENLIKAKPEVAKELAKKMDDYLTAVNARKIEDVYKARFTELNMFKKKSLSHEKQRLEKALKETPSDKHESLKEEYAAKMGNIEARYDKQIEHCQMQTLNENFIGGNHKKNKD